MPTTVLAVYQDGVLRPAHPLPLAEGETVEVTVSEPKGTPLTEDEIIRRMKAAKTLTQLLAAYESAPLPDDEYDLSEALNENRRLAGEPPVYPPDQKGDTW